MKLNNQITKLATAARCELSVITRAGDCHWHAIELMPAGGGWRMGFGKTAKDAIQFMKLAPIVKTTN